jgi:hypothetical protein
VPKHYVLDHNFPFYVAQFLWPKAIIVSRLADVDRSLISNRDDWEVLLALDKRGDIDGFITNDARMLLQPKEMIALSRTALDLVITDGVGHEPLQATGLVMVHLERIAASASHESRIVVVRPAALRPRNAWEQINVIAQHLNVNVNSLVEVELASMGLQRRPR